MIKRDEFKSFSQAQVAASLNVFGLAISFLLSPDIKQLLPEEANLAFRQLADGFHLLSDHQNRLSLARRACIKPSLSLVDKNAADNAPVDEWLFGSSFAEDLKDAQDCKKAVRDLLRLASSVAKLNNQSFRHPQAKHQNLPQPKTSGNSKTPARRTPSSVHHAGARRTPSRYRDRTHSRSRLSR